MHVSVMYFLNYFCARNCFWSVALIGILKVWEKKKKNTWYFVQILIKDQSCYKWYENNLKNFHFPPFCSNFCYCWLICCIYCLQNLKWLLKNRSKVKSTGKKIRKIEKQERKTKSSWRNVTSKSYMSKIFRHC